MDVHCLELAECCITLFEDNIDRCPLSVCNPGMFFEKILSSLTQWRLLVIVAHVMLDT